MYMHIFFTFFVFVMMMAVMTKLPRRGLEMALDGKNVPALQVKLIRMQNTVYLILNICLYSFTPVSSSEPHLRCSKNNIPKARMRTLKMSIVIVICFIVCWTPYYLLGLWYWFFPDDLEGKVSHSLTHILFIFGLFNACLDPIIYGLFTIRFRRGLRSGRRFAHAVTSFHETKSAEKEALNCTAMGLSCRRGVRSEGKAGDCSHTVLKSTDMCLTVFTQGGRRSHDIHTQHTQHTL